MEQLLGILAGVAWIWLIVIAFRNESSIWWGVAIIVISPVAFLYGLMRLRIAFVPWVLLVVSFGMLVSLALRAPLVPS